MNNFLIVISVFITSFFLSCDNRLGNSVNTTFYTQDSLYEITFDKPLELDTFYTWKDEDDNACSDERKYRFSKTGFPVQRETGFLGNSFADSTYRITLKHVEGFDCRYGENMDAREYLIRLLEKYKGDNPRVNIDTLFSKKANINGQEFIMFAYKIKEDYYITKDYNNGYWTNYLKAITIKDGNSLVFTADCRTKNCNGFIQRMEESFNSIIIKKIHENPK